MTDISTLPVPTDEQKQQYIQATAPTPSPAAAPAGADLSGLPIPTPEQVQRYTATPGTSGADISGLPVPTSAQKQQYTTEAARPGAAESPLDRELSSRSFFDRPALRAQEVAPEEVSAIAQKQGVDAQQLQSLAPYFGARMAGKEPQEAVGYAGELALGIPQKLYKMAQDPKMERALDDVQALASGRESYLGLAGQVATPVLPGAGAGASLGKVLAHGAALGGIAGAAAARRGEELQGAAFGGTLGTVLGAVGRKISQRAAPEAEKALSAEAVRSAVPDIDRGTQDILETQKDSLQAISDHITGSKELDTESASKIVSEQMQPEQVERYLNPQTEEGQLLAQRAQQTLPDVVEKEGAEAAAKQTLAQDIVDKKTEEFASWLTDSSIRDTEKAQQAIQDYADRQGGEAALQDRWKNFQTERAGEQYVTDSFIRPGREGTFLNKAINNVSDAQFVLRDIDNRAGTRLEPIHDELNTQINRMSYARQGFQKDLDDIFRQARSTGVDEAVVGSDKIYNALDTGDLSGLSPQEADIAQRFRQYFDKGLDYVNGVSKEGESAGVTPLSIPRREDYVPHQLLPIRQIQAVIQDKLSSTGLDIASLDKPAFREALQAQPQLAEVVNGLGVLDSRATPKSGAELLARIHDQFGTKEGVNAIDTVARAAMERGDAQIPDWMRQKNLYKLADSWTSSTLRHMYLRDSIEKLGGQMRSLKASGADLEAGYIRNLLTDLQGAREGTMAAYTNTMGDRYDKAIDRMVTSSSMPGAQEVGGALKAIPAMMKDATRNIYANILGLSSHAALLHVLHPFVKTLPEVGMTPYGMYSMLRGTARAVMSPQVYQQAVEHAGLIPAEMVPKYRQAIEEGIRRSALYAVPQDAVQKLGEVGLYVFRKFDILNRMLSHGMAESIIEDSFAGSQQAQKAIARLPRSIQISLERAPSQADAVQVLSSYLNASTSYNYNRASMSEFGRTMGPFFSTFSKWPTATAGEIMAEYREKGLTKGTMRNFEKFMAPLMILKSVDTLIKHYGGNGEGEFSDREKVALGHGGLSEAAPLGSIGAIATGKLFAPPALDMLLRTLVEPIKEGKPDKAINGLIGGIQEFAPGAGYVRFVTDDLVTYLTGHRPEGSNFIERTASGARELNKK